MAFGEYVGAAVPSGICEFVVDGFLWRLCLIEVEEEHATKRTSWTRR